VFAVLRILTGVARVMPALISTERLALGLTTKVVEPVDRREFVLADRIVADSKATELAIELLDRISRPPAHPNRPMRISQALERDSSVGVGGSSDTPVLELTAGGKSSSTPTIPSGRLFPKAWSRVSNEAREEPEPRPRGVRAS
jgi:hypothetical protein